MWWLCPFAWRHVLYIPDVEVNPVNDVLIPAWGHGIGYIAFIRNVYAYCVMGLCSDWALSCGHSHSSWLSASGLMR